MKKKKNTKSERNARRARRLERQSNPTAYSYEYSQLIDLSSHSSLRRTVCNNCGADLSLDEKTSGSLSGCTLGGDQWCQCHLCLGFPGLNGSARSRMSRYCPACKLKAGFGNQLDKQCASESTGAIRTLKWQCSIIMIVLSTLFLIAVALVALWKHNELVIFKRITATADDLKRALEEGELATKYTADADLEIDIPDLYTKMEANSESHVKKREVSKDKVKIKKANYKNTLDYMPNEMEDNIYGPNKIWYNSPFHDVRRPPSFNYGYVTGNLDPTNRNVPNEIPRDGNFREVEADGGNVSDNLRPLDDEGNCRNVNNIPTQEHSRTQQSPTARDANIENIANQLKGYNGGFRRKHQRKWRTVHSVPGYIASNFKPHNPSPRTDDQLADDSDKWERPQSSEKFEECLAKIVPDRDEDVFGFDSEGNGLFSGERKWHCLINSLPIEPLTALTKHHSNAQSSKTKRSVSSSKTKRSVSSSKSKRSVSSPKTKRSVSKRIAKFKRLLTMSDKQQTRMKRSASTHTKVNYVGVHRLANEKRTELQKQQQTPGDSHVEDVEAMSAQEYDDEIESLKLNDTAAELIWSVTRPKISNKRNSHAGATVKARRTRRKYKPRNNIISKSVKRNIVSKKLHKRLSMHDACQAQQPITTSMHVAKTDHDQQTCSLRTQVIEEPLSRSDTHRICRVPTSKQGEPHFSYPLTFQDPRPDIEVPAPKLLPWNTCPSSATAFEYTEHDNYESVPPMRSFLHPQDFVATSQAYSKTKRWDLLNYSHKLNRAQCKAKRRITPDDGKIKHVSELSTHPHPNFPEMKGYGGVQNDAVNWVTRESVGETARNAEQKSKRQHPNVPVHRGPKDSRSSLASEDEALVEEFNVHGTDNSGYEDIRRAQAKLMMSHMDLQVDPCDNFYKYACGNWSQQHPLPRDKSSFDTFEMLRETLDQVLKEVLESPIEDADQHSTSDDAWVKAQNLYASCINTDIVEQLGSQPLLDLISELGGWPIITEDWDDSNFDWVMLVAELRLYNNDILIGEYVGPDMNNAEAYIIQFDQSTLGLPTKDYFILPQYKPQVAAYKKFIVATAVLLGAPHTHAAIEAAEIVRFETGVATIIKSLEVRNSMGETYNRTTVKGLKKLVPQINWRSYLEKILGRHVRSNELVAIMSIPYFQKLAELINDTPNRVLSNYILWRFVRHRVSNLDMRFLQIKQDFYKVIVGREELPPRWKVCVAQVNSNMGMALGAMFIDRYFTESSKTDTFLMTKSIIAAFRQVLEDVDWLEANTKYFAVFKLDSMLMRIGYPKYIRNTDQLNCRYEDMDIAPDKYFENTLNVLQHLMRIEHDRAGRVINKTAWNTPPATVNAYYSRNKNQIIFPAGILQPPFYHQAFPKSINYGGIGVVIGHEITHGYDDRGRLFDDRGNLCYWWTEQEVASFKERANCLIEQYNDYVMEEVNQHVNGLLTQGENIADNGGIKHAYKAYHKWLEGNLDGDETMPGLNMTNDQLFFLNFAQVWCGETRPEAVQSKLEGTHSPHMFRVIGSLSNTVEFSSAYNCPLGSPMNPEKKCGVW